MLIFQRLRYWIWGGYSIPIILMIVSATVVTINVGRVRQEADELTQSRKIAENIADLALDVQLMSQSVRGYLLDANPASRKALRQAQNEYQNVVPLLESIIENEEQARTFQEVNRQVEELREFHDGLVELVDQGNLDEARQVWQSGGVGVEIAETIFDLLEEFRTRELMLVTQRKTAQTQALNNLVWVVWGSIGVAVVISIGLGVWIITTIIQRITQEATNIALAATEISTTIEQQERVAVQQAASVNQTTTSMDELGASSRQSADQASAASSGARQVLELAGSDRRDGSFDDTPSLREKMGQVQGQILRLSENLGQIYNITNLVSDLANQTNMLALNASVEAVRAGEHGKGFGVVASEIRKLADQSRKSAEKIGSLIADIQNATNSTVIVTEEGTKAVEKIVNAINDVAVNIQQISLNAKQQAIAIEQVIDAMNNLNTAAHETANGLAQSKIGTRQLNETAQNLKNLV